MSSTGLRGHSLKLYKEQARLDVRKYFFSHRVVDTWNALPETVIGCNNVNTFKIKLDLNLNDRGYISSLLFSLLYGFSLFGRG